MTWLRKSFKYDGKQVALCRTDPLQVGFGPWFELDWTGRPNHSMDAYHSSLCSSSMMMAVSPRVEGIGGKGGGWIVWVGGGQTL
ncbi:hypothetical protein TIFTF001_029194 [Ficus carica]|uniref:Uncharacterized protein n=1 Tax=Ficus carica TaxID=3494 RepID=A0AA88DR49_FICCA|nr:hypothetical protein TIFTF001_029194 [Ficus carica]